MSANNVLSTSQAVNQLNQAQNYLDSRKPEAGGGAQRTVDDINQVLKDAKNLVQEKNLGDAIGKLSSDAKIAEKQLAAQIPSGANAQGVNAQLNASAIRDESYLAANQLRRISQLVVTSPSFRNFLWQSYCLLRDTFGPEVDRALEQRLKDGQDNANQAPTQTQQLKEQYERNVQEAQGQIQQRKENIKQSVNQGDLKSAAINVRDGINRDAKNFVLENVSRDHRDQISSRWEALRNQLRRDPNLRAAVEDLKETLFRLRDAAQPIINQSAGNVKQTGENIRANSQEALARVAADARELVEKFAGGKSFQNLINSLQDWVQAISNDQELRQWVQNLYAFISTDASRIVEDQNLDRLNQLIDQGRQLTQGRHKRIAENLLEQSRECVDALRNDRTSNNLRNSLERVVNDLFIDNQGKFVVKPDLYLQLKDALVPSLGEMFRDIYVAHVEERNDEIDFALDNLLVDASDLQPNQITVTNTADITLANKTSDVNLRFRIACQGCNPKIRNARFRYEKHTFPKLSDFGTLNASLSGSGLSFSLDVEYVANIKVDANNANNNNSNASAQSNTYTDVNVERMFRVNDCTVNVNNLKLDFINSQHETLYAIFKPLVNAKVARQIERTVKEQLTDYVDKLDEAATQARRQAAFRIEEAAGDRIVRGVDNNVGRA